MNPIRNGLNKLKSFNCSRFYQYSVSVTVHLRTNLSTSSLLIVAKAKHSVIPLTARSSTNTQYQRSRATPANTSKIEPHTGTQAKHLIDTTPLQHSLLRARHILSLADLFINTPFQLLLKYPKLHSITGTLSLSVDRY